MELRIIVRIKISELGTAAGGMNRSQVQMQEGARMLLRGLVLVNVQERCLHEGKTHRQVHRNGSKRSHPSMLIAQSG